MLNNQKNPLKYIPETDTDHSLPLLIDHQHSLHTRMP